MRENMLLQHTDDTVKVEMESLRQEMLRLVGTHSCLKLLLDKEMNDDLVL